jgi:PAS domain-containing protein
MRTYQSWAPSIRRPWVNRSVTDDYLIKPFSARELLALVETHVKMARMRRDAQIALRESEERLRLANLATNDAICDWEIDTDTLVWNQGIETLFGWSYAASPPHTVAWWIERIHPDDRDRVSDHFFKVSNNSTKTVWQEEYQSERRMAHMSAFLIGVTPCGIRTESSLACWVR